MGDGFQTSTRAEWTQSREGDAAAGGCEVCCHSPARKKQLHKQHSQERPEQHPNHYPRQEPRLSSLTEGRGMP